MPFILAAVLLFMFFVAMGLCRAATIDERHMHEEYEAFIAAGDCEDAEEDDEMEQYA